MNKLLLELQSEYATNASRYDIKWNDHVTKINNNSESSVVRRPRKIQMLRAVIDELISSNQISTDFTLLDLFCGDGQYLVDLKQIYPNCKAAGVDAYTKEFSAYGDVTARGIELYKIPIQLLYQHQLDRKVDVLICINSYRAFSNAFLSPGGDNPNPNTHINLGTLNTWIRGNAKYFLFDHGVSILTNKFIES